MFSDRSRGLSQGSALLTAVRSQYLPAKASITFLLLDVPCMGLPAHEVPYVLDKGIDAVVTPTDAKNFTCDLALSRQQEHIGDIVDKGKIS